MSILVEPESQLEIKIPVTLSEDSKQISVWGKLAFDGGPHYQTKENVSLQPGDTKSLSIVGAAPKDKKVWRAVAYVYYDDQGVTKTAATKDMPTFINVTADARPFDFSRPVVKLS